MALKTRCATPGAVFTTHIGPSAIEITVALPMDLDLSEADAVFLEATLHNAVELALAPLFRS